MNQTLQAERDLRARIKARLEHRCLRDECQEHGPADAADIMLVSYIYTAEHIRHYGTGSPLTTKAAEVDSDKCPECGGWFDAQVVNPDCKRCVARLSSRMEYKDVAPKPVEGHGECSECGSLAGVLNIGTLDGPLFMCCSCICKLTAERDHLRKEVEDLKHSRNLYKQSLNEWLEKTNWVQDEAVSMGIALGQHRADGIKQYVESLRSRFSWKPVSTPPTEKDAAETPAGKCVIWGNQRGEWLDHWNAIFSSAQYPPTHWRHLNFPPLPESEEDDSRKEFETWWYSTDPDSSRPDMMDISQEAAWTIWSRSRKSLKQP